MADETRSSDGTTIVYERSGRGPMLIIVDGALCSRQFGPSAALAAALANDFTVFRYDRRGRGESSDAEAYAMDREIDDIRALIEDGGGRASLLGLSSGGALALHAAAAGLRVDGVVAYEPPYVQEGASAAEADHESQLRQLLSRGDRGGAVTYFMHDMVGAPWFVPVMMRMFFWMWPKLKAVAPTLPYDAAVMTRFRVPRERFSRIGVPALILNGSKTDARLKNAARAVAQAIPGAGHAELDRQTHNVKPAVLAPAVVDFMKAALARNGR